MALVAITALALVAPACDGNGGGTPSDCEESPTRGFAGSAHLEASGDISSTDDLCVLSAAEIATDLGGFAFTWEGETGLPSLTILGPIEEGTRRTGSLAEEAPVVTIVLKTESSPAAFLSNDGGCSVTIVSVDANAVSGSLKCDALSTSDASVTIEAEATFGCGVKKLGRAP